jgi:fructose-1,6-bisphosphatase/inositol monophosphatase family enzyme
VSVRGAVPAVADVTALVEHVARTVVAPRFGDLAGADVGEKGPGDVVTVVDHAAEEALTAGLRALAPGVPVLGEEAAAADPALLDAIPGAPLAWVVDPLDGTRAFVEGSPDYAVMVGLVAAGEPVAGWICLPEHRLTVVAERGSGAWRRDPQDPPDAVTRLVPPAVPDADAPRMLLAGRYLPTAAREGLVRRIGRAAGTGGVRLVDSVWSGREYARLALGEADAMLAWRTLPWDHVPGVAVLRELGGVARRFDGADYRADVAGLGMVVAVSAEVADAVAEAVDVAALEPLTRSRAGAPAPGEAPGGASAAAR